LVQVFPAGRILFVLFRFPAVAGCFLQGIFNGWSSGFHAEMITQLSDQS
jgi:hypothetical protein